MNVLLAAINNAVGSGVSISLSTTELFMLAVALIIFAAIMIFMFRQYIANSILGIAVLMLLNTAGLAIPLNILTIVISAALGLFGVALLVILYTLGFKL